MFLRRSPREDPALIIHQRDLVIRPPRLDDFETWSSVRAQSRAFLEPWEPIWPEDDLTRAAFRRRLRRYDQEIARDEAYPFLVFRSDDVTLLGGLTLGNVRRGVAQTAALGYWMSAAHAGQGIMTRAVITVCQYAFARLGLRRIEAACLPDNGASIRLLEKAGFHAEGRAREYLCIAGTWRDHLLFSRLVDDTLPAAGEPARRSAEADS